MKKLSLLTLAAAGLLMVGCSDKDVVVDNTPQNLEEFKDGAYLGISLQLPTADRMTRANDTLSNGTKDEFAVKNATLYIFKLAKNSTDNPDLKATFVSYVSLGADYEKDNQPGIDEGVEGVTPEGDIWGKQNPSINTNITSTSAEATLIPNALASQIKSDNANNYYAYVIINHNGQVPNLNDGTGSEPATTFEGFSGELFDEIGADIAAEANIWESGLLMTNAPICSVPGGEDAPENPKYTTLVVLNNSMIFGSKSEAESHPAACVYVERAAAKITVADERAAADKVISNGSVDYNVVIKGWQVINNEPEYYNTRHIEETWGDLHNTEATSSTAEYRFVSLYKFSPTLPSKDNHTTGYRTYFAKDPHYNTNANDDPDNPTYQLANTVASDARPWIAPDKHAYTTENTFDVDHQTWRNTTMVTLKVQIGDANNNFYTVGKGGQTMYLENDAKAAIENVIKNDPAVTTAYNDLLATISNNNKSDDDKTVTVTGGLKVTITTAPTEGTTDVKFTVAPDFKITTTPTGGSATTADADYQGEGEGTLKTELETAIKNVMYSNPLETNTSKLKTADAVLLSYYKGGISYYNVRIKHFGDFETPWSATGNYINGAGVSTSEIYGTDSDAATNNFLGRYGVVRDNWYKLSINKIGKIGTAEPVDPSKTTPDTPDDEIENYISVHVHIVPWVLRSQTVIL